MKSIMQKLRGNFHAEIERKLPISEQELSELTKSVLLKYYLVLKHVRVFHFKWFCIEISI